MDRRWLVAAPVLLLAVGCTQHGSLPKPDAVTLEAPLSIAMDTRTGPPVVPVRINGQGPYPMILDTGAAGSVIAEPLARTLGLPEQAQASMGAAGSGRTVPATLTRLQTVTVEGLALTGVSAVFGDLAVVQRAVPDVQGVLSAGMLNGLLVTFDYPAGQLRIERGELPAADDRTVFEWPAADALPSLPADVDGRQVRLDLDTGANGGFVLAADVANQLAWRDPPVAGRTVRTVDGESPALEGRMRGSVHLGKYVFGDPAVGFRPDGTRSRVGYAVLKDFAVTLDPRNRRVRMQAP